MKISDAQLTSNRPHQQSETLGNAIEVNMNEAFISQQLMVPYNSDHQAAHSPGKPVDSMLASETGVHPRTLLNLPAEIQLGILDFIRAPTDLKSLCLTCKALHTEATARLYRRIILPVKLLTEDLVKSLNIHNRALAHVRIFEIYGGGSYHYDQTSQGVYLWQILRALPRDALTAIWINTRYGVSSWIDETIVQRQGKLLNFVSHVAGTPGITPYTLPKDKLVNITSFALHIESTHDIARYLSILNQLRNLTNLNITILYVFDDGSEHHAVSTPDVITTLLHGAGQSPGLRGKVTRILLDGFDFEYCAQDLVHFLHVNPIRHLAFVGCQDSWKVLKKLAKHPINLCSFVDEDFNSFEYQYEAATSFNSFLRSFEGLRELKRTYEPVTNEFWNGGESVAWAAIQAHSSALRVLQIDDVLEEVDCWTAHRNMDAFEELCISLVSLEQLAIRPPNANRDYWTAPDGFTDFLGCLMHLGSLTALMLMVRPESLRDYVKEYDGAAQQSPIPHVTHIEMQELADLVFSALCVSCPRLKAVAFYATGNWNAEDSRHRLLGHGFAYMRATQIDEYGRSSIAARPIAIEAIKYHEPCSDIFEECIDANWATELV